MNFLRESKAEGMFIRNSDVDMDRFMQIEKDYNNIRRSKTPDVEQYFEEKDESVEYYDSYHIQMSIFKHNN